MVVAVDSSFFESTDVNQLRFMVWMMLLFVSMTTMIAAGCMLCKCQRRPQVEPLPEETSAQEEDVRV